MKRQLLVIGIVTRELESLGRLICASADLKFAVTRRKRCVD